MRIAAPTTVFIPAVPIEPLVDPVYPPAALAAGTGRVTFAVNVSVGKDGRVTAVRPSLAGVSIPTRFDPEFHEAIEAALAQWRFDPAKWAALVPQADGRPLVTGLEDTEDSFDLSFTFSPL